MGEARRSRADGVAGAHPWRRPAAGLDPGGRGIGTHAKPGRTTMPSAARASPRGISDRALAVKYNRCSQEDVFGREQGVG